MTPTFDRGDYRLALLFVPVCLLATFAAWAWNELALALARARARERKARGSLVVVVPDRSALR